LCSASSLCGVFLRDKLDGAFLLDLWSGSVDPLFYNNENKQKTHKSTYLFPCINYFCLCGAPCPVKQTKMHFFYRHMQIVARCLKGGGGRGFKGQKMHISLFFFGCTAHKKTTNGKQPFSMCQLVFFREDRRTQKL